MTTGLGTGQVQGRRNRGREPRSAWSDFFGDRFPGGKKEKTKDEKKGEPNYSDEPGLSFFLLFLVSSYRVSPLLFCSCEFFGRRETVYYYYCCCYPFFFSSCFPLLSSPPPAQGGGIKKVVVQDNA